MKRKIEWEPGFDFRNDPNPKKSEYGCHGMQIRFLYGNGDEDEKCAVPSNSFKLNCSLVVQFVIATGWMPTWGCDVPENRHSLRVEPFDLGVHSSTPLYENHQPGECQYLTAGKCYYDGSALNAEKPFKILIKEGEESLWKFLEEYYNQVLKVKGINND